MKLSKSNEPPGTHILYISFFHVGHLRSGRWHDLAHYKPMGKCCNCSICNINDIIQSQTHQISLSCTVIMAPYLIFAFSNLCNITDDVTGILLGHQKFFSSIISNLIAIESPERHHCSPESTNMQLVTLAQSIIWRGVNWPWPRGQPWLWLLPNKKDIIQRYIR